MACVQSNLEDRLQKAESAIRKPSFLENKGLGNEVGYYVFSYDPKDELTVRNWVNRIQSKYSNGEHGFKVMVFDLYDIIIDVLESKGYIDKIIDFERKQDFNRIVKAINNTLKITSSDCFIIDYIKQCIAEKQVIFLTGIGKCYPILRAHTILNNLHQIIDSVPIVLFYPGKYNGQELIMFDEIKDDNYYRAFRLVDEA